MHVETKPSYCSPAKLRYNSIKHLLALTFISLICFDASAQGQNSPNSYSSSSWGVSYSQQQRGFGITGSPAYSEEVTHLLFKEANLAAAELSLPDSFSRQDVIKVMIYPPRLAKNMRGLGSIATSNYIYSVSCGYKFSGISRTYLQKEDDALKSKYVFPMDQIDTNAAFQLAMQFLTSASMDVTALNHDCRVHISASICPDYEHFVPIYTVQWVKRRERFGNAASVEVFLPDKSLRQLHVYKPDYILSQPAQITNPDFLNLPTNAPPGRPNFGLPP